MPGENVFLGVVEVRLAQLYAWVGFRAWNVDRTLVDAVVLETGLQEDTFRLDRGDVEGCEEGLEDAGWVALSLRNG